MPSLALFLYIILLWTHLVTALPFTFRLSPYAPVQVQCPAEPLIRPADGLSAGETQYVQQRYSKASQSLREFFLSLNANRPPNETFPALTGRMPMMAFASSGGGVRALLSGAGVIQALDDRDPAANASPLRGLWQSMCYHTGLSGGSWLLGALAGNDGTTVSSLTIDLWISSFSDPSFLPFGKQGPDTYARLFLDILAKLWAGFPATLVDAWGRLISQHLLKGDDSGVGTTFSGLVNTSDFQTSQTPYPIITALGVNPVGSVDECISGDATSTQYEFDPFSYGSWDSAIRSFALTEFMGSLTSGGMALSTTSCVTGFDNLGLFMAISSNLFNTFCSEIPQPNSLFGQLGAVQGNVIKMTQMAHGLSFVDEYGVLPNPYVSSSPGQQSYASDELYLVDGGQGGENIPLWPLIQPERNVDLIFANDNSADTYQNWPNGTSLYHTYLRAQDQGLTTMPTIPPSEVIEAQNPGRLPLVFGCYDLSKITIIWLPNRAYSFQSNIPSWVLLYSSSDVQNMIANGGLVATIGGSTGDITWPTCLGCIMLNRSNQGQGLPSVCSTCFDRFCWSG